MYHSAPEAGLMHVLLISLAESVGTTTDYTGGGNLSAGALSVFYARAPAGRTLALWKAHGMLMPRSASPLGHCKLALIFLPWRVCLVFIEI